MKKKSSLYIAVFTVFTLGLGSLIWSGVQSESVYFLNVSEALAMPENELKSARLFGLVAEQDLQKISTLDLSFLLIDAQNTTNSIKVNYTGAIPDTFAAGAEVIVEGTLDNQGTFHAKSLMTKCPSKYEKDNRQV